MNGSRSAGVASLTLIIAVLELSCTSAASDNPVQQVAVVATTQAASPGTGAHQPLYEAPAPQHVTNRPVSPPAIVPAAKHAGHTANEATGKSLPTAAGAAATTQLPPSADVLAKQAVYLQKWQQAQAGWAALSPEEQDSHRAALKVSVLGN